MTKKNLAMAKKNSQRRTKSAKYVIYKTCVDGWYVATDTFECIHRCISFNRTPEYLELQMDYLNGGRQWIDDAEVIMGCADRTIVKSLLRGILEACALHMSSKERRHLLISMGFPINDDLSQYLRDNYFSNGTYVGSYGRVLKQQFFRDVEWAKVQSINALYRIISANPNAFCLMLAKP